VTIAEEKNPGGKVTSLKKILDNGLEWICILLLAVITVDLLLGVFSRYVLGRTFVWYDEVARACFMWLVFLSSAVAVRKGAHFGLHMFVEVMPPRLKRAVLLLTPLTIIVFSAALVSLGWDLMRHGASQSTAVMGLPMSWIYAAMPAGGLLMAFYACLLLIEGAGEETAA
jgi:TRAP-type C4-dicarboxylate transport system permease small subunit